MVAATSDLKRRRVLILSAFLFLQMFVPYLQLQANAAIANYQVFAQSSGASSIVSPSRVEGGVKLTYAQGKVYAYSVGRYSAPSFNDSDLTYQSALHYGPNPNLPLTATKISCDASFNIRLYDKNKTKIATLKLIVYNTSGGPCTNDKLESELGDNQIKNNGGDGDGGSGSEGDKGDDGSGTKPSDPDTPPDTGGCDSCAVFECPKWDEYMSKIDDIINKIPPPTDWDKVIGKADPPVIDDIQTPDKPNAPSKPNLPSIFDILEDVDDKNHKPPKMEDNSDDIGDFEELDDVKAPNVQEDDSGGFDIKNPLDNLSDGSDAPRPQDESVSPPTPQDEQMSPPRPKDEQMSPPRPKDEQMSPPTPQDESVSPPVTDDYLDYPIPQREEVKND